MGLPLPLRLSLYLGLLVLLYIINFPFLSPHWNIWSGLLPALLDAQIQHGTRIYIDPARNRQATAWEQQESIINNASSTLNPYISPLLRCPHKTNPKTNHIRHHQVVLHSILQTPDHEHPPNPLPRYFNPTFIPLPQRSPHQYLLLSRLVTVGLHQESHICFASLETQENTSTILRCQTGPQRLNVPPTPALHCEGAWSAFPDIPGFHDPRLFWSGKGEPLVIINSGSQYGCVGLWVVDVRAVLPELKDLLDKKSGSYDDKDGERGGDKNANLHFEAKMSYPYLTEVTRNPRSSRSPVEKNWVLFFPKEEEAWVQYDLVAHGSRKKEIDADVTNRDSNPTNDIVGSYALNSTSNQHQYSNKSIGNEMNNLILLRKKSQISRSDVSSTAHNLHYKPDTHLHASRSVAKLIGNGYTTQNLTSPHEIPCLNSMHVRDANGHIGHWHQGSNSLRLILCRRHDIDCLSESEDEDIFVESGKVVHFAVLHRKFSNEMDLPMRYERYFVVWEARRPFRMVGISRHPILFGGERARGWGDEDLEGQELGEQEREENERWNGTYFTYTPSIAWSFGRHQDGPAGGWKAHEALGTGYLGEDVMVGIGMDDVQQGFVRVRVEELLGCLRLCPDFENTPDRVKDTVRG